MKTRSRNIAIRAIAATSISVAALSFSPASYAQSSGILSGWGGSATVGANRSTGNSESTNVHGSVRVGKTVGRWEHVLFGSIFQGEATLVNAEEDANGVVSRTIIRGDTSDRLTFGYQPKFYYSDRTYFFAVLDWEQDEPANIDQSTRQVIGVGYRFFSNSSGFLSGEVGVGNKNTDVFSGDDFSGGIGYAGLNYLNRLNENATFTADFRSDFGSDNTFVEIGVGFGLKVSDNISFKLSYFARNNSDLSSAENPLSTSTDSVTTFSLVFDI